MKNLCQIPEPGFYSTETWFDQKNFFRFDGALVQKRVLWLYPREVSFPYWSLDVLSGRTSGKVKPGAEEKYHYFPPLLHSSPSVTTSDFTERPPNRKRPLL